MNHDHEKTQERIDTGLDVAEGVLDVVTDAIDPSPDLLEGVVGVIGAIIGALAD